MEILTYNPVSSGRQDGMVVGVDIGGTNLRLALATKAGVIVDRRTTSTVGMKDPEKIVQLVCDSVDAMLVNTATSRNQLIGIGVGAPGITDSDQGIVLATSYLLGWKNVALRTLLQDAFEVPVFVDNDVNMAVFGEFSAGSARGLRDFVFLAIGTGVGAGIMIDGQVFRGKGWLAGEIGYMLVPGVSTEPIQKDSPGALEEMVGGEGIRKLWRKEWTEGCSLLGIDATATQIFDQAVRDDASAKSVLHKSAQTLAYAIYNLSLILNCPLFVLGGSVGLHPVLLRETEIVLKRLNDRVQPTLVLSSLSSDAQIIGAIFRAIEIACHPI